MLEISIEKNCPIKIYLKKLTEKFPDFKANIFGHSEKINLFT